MVSLISANATQLKVAFQEKPFGLHSRTEFLNEMNKMSNSWEQKGVVSSVKDVSDSSD